MPAGILLLNMFKSEETRSKILDAALDLFRERGFDAATMREIAARAGVATGLAYYYFKSKEDLVLAFYWRAKDEMAPQLENAHTEHRKLEGRLRALIQAKLDYFNPNRKFLAALIGFAADPKSPLSPFGEQTREIRDADVAQFDRALRETNTNVPKDLAPHLARMLWLYQLGQIFYWLYDDSPGQRRAQALLDKSMKVVLLLIKLSSLPLMRPARRMVVELIEVIES